MTEQLYIGRPWRARFLRAPLVARKLALRTDFVPLGSIATVALGLKTGADSFFFVEPTAPAARGGTDDELPFGDKTSRKTLAVRGLNAWKGRLLVADLLPAVRNPHELFIGDRRLFRIPRRAAAYYLSPRDRAPAGGLADYIAMGERLSIDQGDLVKSNAGEGRWYRQTRGVVRPAWVLPYNSAYDYGAWDNSAGAVINGRLVGVDPAPGVNPDLLGAVLNTTMVMATRLLEGVATGSEGALDVGPPAARLMMVPDPRRMDAASTKRVMDLLAEWRKANDMPAAPDRHAAVDPQRNQLDEAVLRALGVAPGDAAVLLGHLYEGYARWRAEVQDVEGDVRVNRRALARSGRDRGQRPVHEAAKTVWDELSSGVPVFPHDWLSGAEAYDTVTVTAAFRADTQRPMFDEGVVIQPDGKRVDLGSWERLRYAEMLVRLGWRHDLRIVADPQRAEAIAYGFNEVEHRLRDEAAKRAAAYVSAGHRDEVAEAVVRIWFDRCRAGGMSPEDSPASVMPAGPRRPRRRGHI